MASLRALLALLLSSLVVIGVDASDKHGAPLPLLDDEMPTVVAESSDNDDNQQGVGVAGGPPTAHAA